MVWATLWSRRSTNTYFYEYSKVHDAILMGLPSHGRFLKAHRIYWRYWTPPPICWLGALARKGHTRNHFLHIGHPLKMASATANVLGAYLIETFLALMLVYSSLSWTIFSIIFLSLRLFGINVSQSYLYWLNRKRDPTILQLTVLAVAAIETLHSTLMMHATYHYLISESCNPSAFDAKIIWFVSFIIRRLQLINALWQPMYRSAGVGLKFLIYS